VAQRARSKLFEQPSSAEGKGEDIMSNVNL